MKQFVFQRRYLLLILTVLAILVAIPSQVKAQDTGVTATVGANVISLQSGPGLDFSSIGTARLNERFEVIGRARGSKRIWYEIKLPSGGTAWVSERVVNIDPSPDSLPWLGDNTAKTPLVMDCGRFRPLLFVGAYAQVTSKDGVILYRDAGLGKPQVGGVAANGLVMVLDGPFCTLLNLNTKRYQIQWLVLNQSGVSGYMLEGLPDAQGAYVKVASGVSSSDFPEIATPSVGSGTPTGSNSTSNTERPSFVTDDDIQTVTAIFEGVQKRTITEKDATSQLKKIVDGRTPAVLAWIVRRVPIYDGKTRGWVSFARYEDQTVMTFNLQSQLDLDPVKTTIAILFGKYKDAVQVFESIGCGGG